MLAKCSVNPSCHKCSVIFLCTLLPFKSVVPNVLGTMGQFRGRQSLHGLEWGSGFGMIQEHYVYWALYFYYYISSTSCH